MALINNLNKLSVYLSYVLRHNPNDIALNMDKHGWVVTQELIDNINSYSKHTLDMETLQYIVDNDSKGRYKFSPDGLKIKACQGHSIPWVEPELEIIRPPEILYHGTNSAAFNKILESGAIKRMSRHAVHMTADIEMAWKSARRWKNMCPMVLEIEAQKAAAGGIVFGKTENDVWCCQELPIKYIRWVIGD